LTLFKFSRLFGIDLPARMAEVRIDLEERFDLAKYRVEQAAQAAAVLAMMFSLASLAAVATFFVGLVALYSWVTSNYGPFYGLAAIGGVLLVISITLFASAMSKASFWRNENASRVAAKKRDLAQTSAARVTEAAKALEGPRLHFLPPPPQSSGATSLSEPLVSALSNIIRAPVIGGPAMDELFARLGASARGVADETIDGLVSAVRYGDRPQLFTAIGGAVIVGWLLARCSQRKLDVLEGR
jgi:hypothetical protein